MSGFIAELREIRLDSAFRTHASKLEALRIALRFLKRQMKKSQQAGVRNPVPFSGGLSVAQLVGPESLQVASKIMELVDEERVRELNGMKQAGFYVCRNRRGQLISPDSVLFVDPQVVRAYVTLLTSFLKGVLHALTEEKAAPAKDAVEPV